MPNPARYRPSPAMIVAVIGPIMASGGGALAATLITGANTKNGAIRGADVANGSLGAGDLAPGTVPPPTRSGGSTTPRSTSTA